VQEIMIRAGEWTNDTQVRELPKQRAAVDEADPVADLADFSLAALVREWVTASEAVERQARPKGDDSPLRPTWTPPLEDLEDHARDVPVVKHAPRPPPVDPVEPVDAGSPMDTAVRDRGVAGATTAPLPALPRRRLQPQPQSTRRLAVLIHAETTTAESAEALFDVLAEQGTVSVCRAYADWTSPEAQTWWSAPLRRHGIQPYHQFGADQDQRSLVALTIDAVELARESAVDVVVLVGDLVSLHPLVVRLNASGLEVIGFGTTATPPDVSALCHEFVDLSCLGHVGTGRAGRHRA
jgi:hypothetical protein